MKKFAENIADLIKVKTIATFVIVAVFAVLALRGSITADNVMIIVSTVIAFYFGTQHEKGSGSNGLEVRSHTPRKSGAHTALHKPR